MSVLAIRVFAAGALLGHPPSAHTLKTPFFPLAVFEHDVARSDALRKDCSPAELLARAIRYPLEQRAVASAIIGFATTCDVADLPLHEVV